MNFHLWITQPGEPRGMADPEKINSWARLYALVTEWIEEHPGVNKHDRNYFTRLRRPAVPLPGSWIGIGSPCGSTLTIHRTR